MHFPSLWSLHSSSPGMNSDQRTWLILKSGSGQRGRNIKDYRAVPPPALPLESNAGNANTGVNNCFCTNSDFGSAFSLKKQNKTCTQEGSYRWDLHSHLHTSCFQGRLPCHHSPLASSSWGSTCLTDFLCPTVSYFSTQRATQIHVSCYWRWALQPELSWLDHLRTHPTSKNSVMDAGMLVPL